jgi:hypothetical protein
MRDESHSRAISDTIDHLAARWGQADKQILRQVFPLLTQGQPVPVARIGEAAGVGIQVVEAALALGRAGRDSAGRVIELSGLMLSPTFHRVQISDVALFSCCALLAQLVPALIDRPVTVESVDPVSRRIVRLAISPEGVTSLEPSGAVASFVLTAAHAVAEDVSANFCCHVRHFASPDSASTFVAADSRRYMLEISELHEAVQKLFREAWGG